MKFALEQFSTALISLDRTVGTSDFYPQLETLFHTLLDFDELLVLKLHKRADVQLLFRFGVDGDCEHLHGEESWKYLSRLYVLDPFYRLFSDREQYGFFSLKAIAPENFTDIYHSYFNFLSLSDELGYLFPIDGDSCLHIDLSRFGDKQGFDDGERQSLQQLFEPLKSLITEHLDSNPGELSKNSTRVETVLSNFGRELLTKKEYLVCQLLLQGHSSKHIASLVEVSYETVKMHKKNIYGKSMISSQSELLALFIDILQQQNIDPEVDHLALHIKNI